jgi:hypothetical protein
MLPTEMNTKDLTTTETAEFIKLSKKEYDRLRYLSKREQIKKATSEWQKANRAKVRVMAQRSILKNAEKHNARARKWYHENKERCSLNVRKWRQKNRQHMIEYYRNYRRNPQALMASRLRSRIGVALRNCGVKKAKKSFKLIGCDGDFLVSYIQARFKTGMSWNNRGLWEIDHKIPCARFDLTKESEQKACFHYSNLQPLWKIENRQKHNKTPEPHQAELI